MGHSSQQTGDTKIKKILLVEDNPTDEMLTIRAFKQNEINNDVIVARDGEEALNILLKQSLVSETFNPSDLQLIVLDLKLPKLNGLEVLKKIRETASIKSLPVVILTTSIEESDLVAAYEYKTNAYVQKPVNYDEFSQAINSLGKFWLKLNRPSPIKRIA